MGGLTLYDVELSGNCHRIRLLLSFLGLPYTRKIVNLAAGDHKTPAFRALNPRGQVPVLVDDGQAIWDSSAILVHLARRYDPRQEWLPPDPAIEVRIQEWLSVAQNEILFGLARARAIRRFGRPFDREDSARLGVQALETLACELADRPWLAADRPTIADVACYPYVALAGEGEFRLADYTDVVAWLSRFEALPGFVTLSGDGASAVTRAGA